MRYLKLLLLFVKTSLLTELEYRANFIAQVLLGALWALVSILSITLFFSHTDRLGGWSYEQAMVVVGIYTIIDGIIFATLEPNVKKLIDMVRQGTLDFVLLKPINSQFMVSAREMKFSGFADMTAGAITIIYALTRAGYTPTLASLAQFALMLLTALLIVYSVWIMMATTSFWFVKVNNLSEAFRAIFDTARFPVSTFQGGLRIVLTFVLPVAFITTVPAQAMLGMLDLRTMLIGFAIGAGVFVFSARFWNYAIRNYSSASS